MKCFMLILNKEKNKLQKETKFLEENKTLKISQKILIKYN